MSRIAKKPLIIPAGVEFKLIDSQAHVKGPKGALVLPMHEAVTLEVEGNKIFVRAKAGMHAMVATIFRLLGNVFEGVSNGCERKLQLVGVGYRAKVQGNALELSLGFSNPVMFPIPKDITIETPTNTEIIIRGIDKQVVGETAAKIRKFRPPECYKGKGIRYSGEKAEEVKIKETKKK